MKNSAFEGMVAKAAREQRKAQYELDANLVGGLVDEVSILFKHSWMLDDFVIWAKEGTRLEHFDRVHEDNVDQLYGRSDYGVPNVGTEAFVVRFEFLRVPGAPWRIEAMCILSGTSAIHDSMDTGDIAHASWKLPDVESYASQQRHLMGENVPLLAEFRNSYGKFSYFGQVGKWPYLKPRVNLRDIQPAPAG